VLRLDGMVMMMMLLMSVEWEYCSLVPGHVGQLIPAVAGSPICKLLTVSLYAISLKVSLYNYQQMLDFHHEKHQKRSTAGLACSVAAW